MAMFLEEDSESTWNCSYIFYGYVSCGEQRNYLKWQLYLLRSYFLRRIAKLPEKTAIPIMAIFLEENSETIWNDSYTYYGQVSWGGQRNYMKWQLYLLRQYFLMRTAKLPVTTAIPIMGMFLRKTAKLHEMTAIPIKAMFLEEDTKTTWNDSYTYNGHVSWGG